MIVTCASVLAAPAAAAPDGFSESASLTPIARSIGSPEAIVYCALTAATWRDAVNGVLPAAVWSNTDGYTYGASGQTFLAPWICKPLEDWKRGRTVAPDPLGRALLAIVHESVHLRGVSAENVAECTALREVHSVARAHFGIKREATWRKVWRGVLTAHSRTPAEYRAC